MPKKTVTYTYSYCSESKIQIFLNSNSYFKLNKVINIFLLVSNEPYCIQKKFSVFLESSLLQFSKKDKTSNECRYYLTDINNNFEKFGSK